jgi:glycosyltransferase involved in cell wall biosynthesis
MKIAMLNTFDGGGGAARSAFRLHQGLLASDIKSVFITLYKKRADPAIVSGPTRLNKVIALIRPLLDMIPMKLYRNRDQRQPFSTAYIPPQRITRKAVANSDLVHLHWIVHGFLNVEYLAEAQRPIVWTLHDSWAFTGGCHLPAACTRYQSKCGQCPQLGSTTDRDLTRLNWHRKARAWKDLKLVIVAPSHWLATCAKNSSLFGKARIEVIPNGIDTKIFKPNDKKVCRQIMGLPEGARIILFGAMGATNDENKGFDLLLKALPQLSKDENGRENVLVIFGAESPLNVPEFGMPYRYMGTITDDIALSVLYSAADVMVVPSRQENLPNTVMEAMACGTPAVAFRTGGLPDLIDHLTCGYLAQPFDTSDLASGIEWVLKQQTERPSIGALCRDKVEREFSLAVVSERYIQLYRELLAPKTLETPLH